MAPYHSSGARYTYILRSVRPCDLSMQRGLPLMMTHQPLTAKARLSRRIFPRVIAVVERRQEGSERRRRTDGAAKRVRVNICAGAGRVEQAETDRRAQNSEEETRAGNPTLPLFLSLFCFLKALLPPMVIAQYSHHCTGSFAPRQLAMSQFGTASIDLPLPSSDATSSAASASAA